MNIRDDFPFFKEYPTLAYLDNASTTQKPWPVIRAVQEAYIKYSATPYRGIYALAEATTEKYEAVRAKTAAFIGSAHANEIAFVSNTTAGINAVAWGWAAANLVPGDEIVLSELEHHANILPWQRLAAERGFGIKWLRINFDGSIAIDALDEVITPQARLVALSAYSNVVGSLGPLAGKDFISRVIHKAHSVGARVLLDAAQMAPYKRLDVAAMDVDFVVFSAHKMLGPGIGLLYAKRETHAGMVPFITGGGMVERVGYTDAHYRPFPHLFEAGTQAVAPVLGWGAAMAYYNSTIDFDELSNHCARLIRRLGDGLEQVPGIHRLVEGSASVSDHLMTFYVDGVHAHDVAAALDSDGICVRAGNHCAELLHAKLGVPASVRVSVYGYNTSDEIDRLTTSLKRLYG